MTRKSLQNRIKAFSQRIDRKKMYKSKKQWIVAGMSLLIAMGVGATVTNVDGANASAHTINHSNVTATTNKKVNRKANHLHAQLLINNARKHAKRNNAVRSHEKVNHIKNVSAVTPHRNRVSHKTHAKRTVSVKMPKLSTKDTKVVKAGNKNNTKKTKASNALLDSSNSTAGTYNGKEINGVLIDDPNNVTPNLDNALIKYETTGGHHYWVKHIRNRRGRTPYQWHGKANANPTRTWHISINYLDNGRTISGDAERPSGSRPYGTTFVNDQSPATIHAPKGYHFSTKQNTHRVHVISSTEATISNSGYNNHVLEAWWQNGTPNNPKFNGYFNTVKVNLVKNQTSAKQNVNYIDNGQVVGHGILNGKKGSHQNIGSNPDGLPSGYNVSNPNQNIPINNGSTNVNVSKQNASQNINYIDNGKTVGTGSLNGKKGDSQSIGSTPNGLPNGYKVNDPSQNITINNGTSNVDVTPKAPAQNTDTVNYQYKGNTLPNGSFQKKGNAKDSFTINNDNHPNLPSGYHLAGDNSSYNIPYDGNIYDISVVPNAPKNDNDTISYRDQHGHNRGIGYTKGMPNKNIPRNKMPRVPRGYHISKNNTPAKYDNGKHVVNLNGNPVHYKGRLVVRYILNGKLADIQTKPYSRKTNVGNTVTLLGKLPKYSKDNEAHFATNLKHITFKLGKGNNRHTFIVPAIDGIDSKGNSITRDYTVNYYAHKKQLPVVSDVNEIHNGELALYKGHKVYRINMDKTKYNHFRWFKINKHGSWIHTNILSVGHNQDYVGYMHPNRAIYHRLTRVFKVHFGGKYGKTYTRYEFKIAKGSPYDYFVSANPYYTVNSYIQPKEVTNSHTVRVIRPISEYKSRYFTKATRIANYGVGKTFHIKKVINIGRKGDYQTRLVLNNGHYITANKNWVKLI